jgi:transcriptional regulator with XRE-family HTH domain
MIADRLRELRGRHALTQRELAARSGLSLMCICFLEQGLREPLASTIVRICRATGESADWLLEIAEKETS